MEIRPPSRFAHAGNLPHRSADRDPRQEDFQEDEVIIDLREVEFILPAAVLWCAIYPLISKYRGINTTLWVPENQGVATYLQGLGLFDLLRQSDVVIDTRGIRHTNDMKVIVPLTPLQSLGSVQILADDAYSVLMERDLGSPEVQRVVGEVFAELAMNAVEHSESPIHPLGFIQFYEQEQGERFAFGIADGGIGIRASLYRNPDLRRSIPYDWTAIEVAMKELVSGTGKPTRGIGLSGVNEEMRQPGRNLIIHSGTGSLVINEELESWARRTVLFPGTLTYASISV